MFRLGQRPAVSFQVFKTAERRGISVGCCCCATNCGSVLEHMFRPCSGASAPPRRSPGAHYKASQGLVSSADLTPRPRSQTIIIQNIQNIQSIQKLQNLQNMNYTVYINYKINFFFSFLKVSNIFQSFEYISDFRCILYNKLLF